MPKIINEHITQVKVKKREVKLDKPIHVGFTVLELRYIIYKYYIKYNNYLFQQTYNG